MNLFIEFSAEKSLSVCLAPLKEHFDFLSPNPLLSKHIFWKIWDLCFAHGIITHQKDIGSLEYSNVFLVRFGILIEELNSNNYPSLI